MTLNALYRGTRVKLPRLWEVPKIGLLPPIGGARCMSLPTGAPLKACTVGALREGARLTIPAVTKIPRQFFFDTGM
jgi:hypothetical protein